MSEFYSRIGSASLIKETTNNTPLTPTTFFNLNDEDLSVEYNYAVASPVKNNRALNISAVDSTIMLPSGKLNINIEPKVFGHFIEGMLGLTSGNYMPITAPSGTFTVGETVTGTNSAKTAVVTADIDGQFLIVSSPSGDFTDGETITGSVSLNTATLTEFDATVYAHVGTAPCESTDTYTLQINYNDRAIRYMGVRFHGIDSVAQNDNIITASIQTMPQSQFRHAKVSAITVAASGAQTITVDQSHGLVVGDSIKLWEPITNVFKDFSATSVKTHTVASVPTSTTFTVTNLETSTAVGDLIVLAPQTASYTVGNEFSFIGGSIATVGADVDSLAVACIEDFSVVLTNEFEPRYCANGTDFEDRFPGYLLQKGFTGSGNFVVHTVSEDFYRLFRKNTSQAFRIKSIGSDVGVTEMQNEVWFVFSNVQFNPYSTNLTQDDIVNEDIPFTSFYDSTQGYSARVVLINDVANY